MSWLWMSCVVYVVTQCNSYMCVLYVYLHVPLSGLDVLLHNELYLFPLLILLLKSSISLFLHFSTFLHIYIPYYSCRVNCHFFISHVIITRLLHVYLSLSVSVAVSIPYLYHYLYLLSPYSYPCPPPYHLPVYLLHTYLPTFLLT